MRYVRRAVFASFGVGLLLTVVALVATIVRSRPLSSPGSVSTEFLTLTFFTSTQTSQDGASSFSLTPGPGVAVLLIVLPVLAGALAWRRDRQAAQGRTVAPAGSSA